ncbi:WcbI family polysaccharide biosynthesis putative acetyltransferase [Roseomonas elaeocarpi]|uniref:WcbI family polysaccharide biosynthesis putative acetyltransferase n=1 Tax=Roseomonas elaeocarpi TaxID=907779 RepID=A0ABV6JVI2_9PROT
MTERLVIYGNCQSIDMAEALQRLPCLSGRYEVNYVAWHLLKLPGHRWEDMPDFAASRVVLWEQVGGEGGSQELLRQRLPRDVSVLRFPPLACTALWPFEAPDLRGEADAPYGGNARYGMGDRIALELLHDAEALRLPDDALYDLYLGRCAAEVPRLERRLGFDRARAEARDRDSDIAFTPFVFENFREQRLFHDPRHIAGPMLREALRMLLRASADRLGIDAEVSCRELDVLLSGHDGQTYSQMPINPLVAEAFGLHYGDAASRIRLNNNSWTFRDYVVNYIRWRPYAS